MKYGNIRKEDIESVVRQCNLSEEKASKLKERLKENLYTFVPCDIPQRMLLSIVIKGLDDPYVSLSRPWCLLNSVDPLRESPDEMNLILNYPKHFSSIKEVALRIMKIFYSDEKIDEAKEMYYRDVFCSLEMMGQSYLFFHKWYSAVILLSRYRNDTVVLDEMFDLYKEILEMGVELTGEYLQELFQQVLCVHFLEFSRTKNPDFITNIFLMSREYGCEVRIYKYMIETNFFTPELNPKKLIIEYWDAGYETREIASLTDLTTIEITRMLVDYKKISVDWFIQSWNEYHDPMEIASNYRLEAQDIQTLLRENKHKFLREYDYFLLEDAYWEYPAW